jgi:sec-independent protein translocase protein TatA
MHPTFAFIEGMFSPMHILVVLVIGILLFGKRLPEVGRSLGKGIVEFKKGLNGLEDEVTNSVKSAEPTAPAATPELPRPPQRVAAPAPQFDEKA